MKTQATLTAASNRDPSSGMCRTHEQQCKLLWGPTGQNSHDACYDLNTEGNVNGNCGYSWENETYYKCNRV